MVVTRACKLNAVFYGQGEVRSERTDCANEWGTRRLSGASAETEVEPEIKD